MTGHSSRVQALRLMIAYAAVAGYLAPRCCCSGAHPKKDWNAAKDSAETPFFAEFDLPKVTETAVRILDDDASMHKYAAAESDQQDATQLTLLDELFSGTWGAFIVKDNVGQSAEWPPRTDSAELSSAGSDELTAEDSSVEVGNFDHPALGEPRLVPDELPSDDTTVTTGDWPTEDVATADLPAAEASAEDAQPSREHGALSIKIGHSSGKDSIRSHWRRGHDQAASRRRMTDVEPVASETVADRPRPAEGSWLSPQRGHHVLTFRFSGPPDAEVAGATSGHGHGAQVKSGFDAGRSAAAAATDETPAQRLPIDGLGHWGRFLPSEQQLRRTPADGDSSHNTAVTPTTAEPGHADRIRRPPLTPEQHQPPSVISGNGRHNVLRSSGFSLALRPHPSAPTVANQPRVALAIAAPAQRSPSERKPDSSALTDTEAGRGHPSAPAAVAANSIDRDGRRRFASGGDRPSSTAAAKAIDDADIHSDGGRLPNPGGGRRVAAAATADAHTAPWSVLSPPLARRQRLPHLHHQHEHGVAVGERGSGGESSSNSWGSVGDQQQRQVAAEHSTTAVDREVHSRVAIAPSRGERRPRPRPTVEGRFVV